MSSTTLLEIGQTSRPKVNVKVKYLDHVRHVGHMGHFTYDPHVAHLQVITHAQRYHFVSIVCTMQN